MGRLRNFRAQVVLGFAGIITMTVAALAVAFVVERKVAEMRDAQLGAVSENQLVASQIELDAERMVASARGYLLTSDDRSLENVERAEHDLEDGVRRLKRIESAGLPERLIELEQAASDYRLAFDSLVDRARAAPKRMAVAQAVEDELVPRRTALSRHIQTLDAYMRHLLEDGHARAKASAARQVRTLFAIGGTGIALALLMAWVTARRLDALYESEKSARRKEERAVEARQELLAVVAHDLRSPLSAVLVRAAMLRRRPQDTVALKSIDAIENISVRIEHLIASLLDASTIEAGRFVVARQPCLAATIVASTLEVFGSLAVQHAVRLEHSVDGTDLAVLGERERIIQVLSNLVSNALKVTVAGGVVAVRVKESGFYARFEVRDDGPGIGPEHLPRVFDRYWKLEAGGRKGAGLGLYIARGIVEAHGGRIWVETEVGRGSSFFFEIPRLVNWLGPQAPTVASSGECRARVG